MIRFRRLLRTLSEIVRQRVRVYLLRREISRLKLLNYDRLEQAVRGLRSVVDTQNRSLADLNLQLEARDERLSQIQADYAELLAQKATTEADVRDAERLRLLRSVQSFAVQLPSVSAALRQGAELTAQDVLDIVAPFERTLHELGFETIGDAGRQTSYEPTRHRGVGRGAHSLTPGDHVRVRYVGYLYKGRVACKAEVTLAEQQEAVTAVR